MLGTVSPSCAGRQASPDLGFSGHRADTESMLRPRSTRAARWRPLKRRLHQHTPKHQSRENDRQHRSDDLRYFEPQRENTGSPWSYTLPCLMKCERRRPSRGTCWEGAALFSRWRETYDECTADRDGDCRGADLATPLWSSPADVTGTRLIQSGPRSPKHRAARRRLSVLHVWPH